MSGHHPLETQDLRNNSLSYYDFVEIERSHCDFSCLLHAGKMKLDTDVWHTKESGMTRYVFLFAWLFGLMHMSGRGGSPAIASPVRDIKGSMLGESIVTTSMLGHARKETLYCMNVFWSEWCTYLWMETNRATLWSHRAMAYAWALEGRMDRMMILNSSPVTIMNEILHDNILTEFIFYGRMYL